jgi:hypothetical protein
MSDQVPEWLATQVGKLIEGNGRIEAKLDDLRPVVDDHERRLRIAARDHATHAEVQSIVRPITGQLQTLGGKMDALSGKVDSLGSRINRVEHSRNLWRIIWGAFVSTMKTTWGKIVAIVVSAAGLWLGTALSGLWPKLFH